MIRARQASTGHTRRKPPLPANARSGSRSASIWRILLAVTGFSLFFGAVIFFKLQQDLNAAHNASEASRARAAAFLAERVDARLSETSVALAISASQVELLEADRLEAAAAAMLDRLTGLPWVQASALLLPDGRIILSGDAGVDDLRDTVRAALDHPSGLAAQAGADFPLTLVEPAPLHDGTVGALAALIDAQALLPQWSSGEIVMLTDAQGRLIALQPPAPFTGAPVAAERLGLDPAVVTRLAQRGGALGGVDLAGQEHVLGAASLSGGALHALNLGPGGIDRQAWLMAVWFHVLLLVAALGTAVALSVMLRNQMGQLGLTQNRLRESENRLRLAIESARCGVWDWNLDTDEVVMTDSFARLIGRTKAEALTGPEMLLLISEADRSRIRTALRSADQAQDVDLEVRAAGIPVWLQLRGRLMGGTRRIVGVAIDITERKGAQARVAAAESRLRAALDSMSESFVLWDARNKLVLWNKKFRDFFGFKDGELRPGMSYDSVAQAAARAVREPHGAESGAETYELELADGRWLHYSERPTAEGGLVSVGADITALKRQEAALKENDRDMRRTVENLRRAQEHGEELARSYEQEKIRAEEANRSKSEFLANMSHELRTPLNAINGFSEIMAGEMFGPLGDERYKDYVQDILGSGQLLLSLINDILDMSKIEAGKMQLQTELLDPSALIEQCVRIMHARAAEKDISMKVESSQLPEIEADPRALKQVLLNLMANAVKFTPEGGKVTIRGVDAADGIVLQVADTGIGISEENLPRVGRPFEQIEHQHSKTHQGSGLGLALSKSLIELHGGTLRIDSVLGKGTTVSFTLPARAAAPNPGEELQDPQITEPQKTKNAGA